MILDSDLTQDDFLGGRLHLRQPAKGYRAGIDAVFLAASLTAQADDKVLELGAGTGAVMCCVLHRKPDLRLTGVERNATYAALARDNLKANRLTADVITADFTAKIFKENA
ncbi:MAG: methyltransferase, partial [Deltaproteobacteria bacterium]